MGNPFGGKKNTLMRLTCEARSHRSWFLCNAPSAVWSKSPALCMGSPTPGLSQYRSETSEHCQTRFITHKLKHTAKQWWKKVAVLHRSGSLPSVCGGSLRKLPHCCGFPGGESPARRPCLGPSGCFPLPAAPSLQCPPPAGGKTSNRKLPSTVSIRMMIENFKITAKWGENPTMAFKFTRTVSCFHKRNWCNFRWPAGGVQTQLLNWYSNNPLQIK